jgi:hypothetical protein
MTHFIFISIKEIAGKNKKMGKNKKVKFIENDDLANKNENKLGMDIK